MNKKSALATSLEDLAGLSITPAPAAAPAPAPASAIAEPYSAPSVVAPHDIGVTLDGVGATPADAKAVADCKALAVCKLDPAAAATATALLKAAVTALGKATTRAAAASSLRQFAVQPCTPPSAAADAVAAAGAVEGAAAVVEDHAAKHVDMEHSLLSDLVSIVALVAQSQPQMAATAAGMRVLGEPLRCASAVPRDSLLTATTALARISATKGAWSGTEVASSGVLQWLLALLPMASKGYADMDVTVQSLTATGNLVADPALATQLLIDGGVWKAVLGLLAHPAAAVQGCVADLLVCLSQCGTVLEFLGDTLAEGALPAVMAVVEAVTASLDSGDGVSAKAVHQSAHTLASFVHTLSANAALRPRMGGAALLHGLVATVAVAWGNAHLQTALMKALCNMSADCDAKTAAELVSPEALACMLELIHHKPPLVHLYEPLATTYANVVRMPPVVRMLASKDGLARLQQLAQMEDSAVNATTREAMARIFHALCSLPPDEVLDAMVAFHSFGPLLKLCTCSSPAAQRIALGTLRTLAEHTSVLVEGLPVGQHMVRGVAVACLTCCGLLTAILSKPRHAPVLCPFASPLSRLATLLMP